VAGGELIGYLGLVPLVMGCYMLSGVVIEDGRGDLPVEPLEVAGKRAVWLSTFILLFSNSGDSIAVFLPLLAESGGAAPVLIVGSFLAMVFFWAGLSCLIAGQRMLAVNIEKRAQKIVPWVMIGVGIYILMDTATDTLF
jgi:cadmium resistance protein CadD (predicted permease)